MRGRGVALAVAGVLCCALWQGCTTERPPNPPAPYLDIGYKTDLPRFMHGTVFERTDVGNTDLYPVSGYSLVVNLQNSGDNSGIPTVVRQAMIKRMALSGFGQHDDPRYTNFQPEDVLADKRVAVVRVIGLLPAGVRRGQQFDVLVQSMPRSRTTSLAHGHLYNTELRNRGLEQPASGGIILAYGDAGDVFVNPVYALEGTARNYPGVSSAQVSASLCAGVVMNGGRATEDRPIYLELRVPQASISRTIESRIIARYPTDRTDRPAAAAEDDGLVYLYVPQSFQGNWHHFVDVVNHIFLNQTPDFVALKVKQLIDEAHKPSAALSDISFCLEGLGPSAVPLYLEMCSDPDPAIAYAAARAAVFCGDEGARTALTRMALDAANPYQLGAVHALGELPQSPALDKELEPLLGSDKDLVRIEAYKILAAHADRRIITQDTPAGFKVDIVDYPGAPLIFATRSGLARFALFGSMPTLAPPVMLAAIQDRLTISTDELGQTLAIYYRDPRHELPVHVKSGLAMSEVLSRLGGLGPPGEAALDFSYSDVVAIVQELSESHAVVAANGSTPQLTPLVLDQPAELTNALLAAQLEIRPQGDAPGKTQEKLAAQAPAAPVAPDAPPASGSVPSFGSP